MATSPQKSPSVPKSPTPKSPPSRKKDDSFLGKLGGTLARRKKAKEGRNSRGRGCCRDPEPGSRGPPGSAGARLAMSPCHLPGPNRIGVIAGPQAESRLWVAFVPESRPSRSPELSARPLSPPSARPRTGICQVSAGKFSRAPSLPALSLHWSTARRRFLGAFRSFSEVALASLDLSRAPRACVDRDDLYKMLVD